uniref:Uncharacterized protein n=1 Tax=Oryza brachyantha TaxID=4533 RepID=J3LV18_ORYBR
MYTRRRNLEEVEVSGHFGAGVLDGHELIEGDDDELLGLGGLGNCGAYGGGGTTEEKGTRARREREGVLARRGGKYADEAGARGRGQG